MKKAKNYVNLTYLDYFRNMDRVSTYSWGTAALAFLYQELTHDTTPNSIQYRWLHDTGAGNLQFI
jgi:hypothetical protein